MVARKPPPFCGIEYPVVPEDGAPSRARMVHLPLEQLVVHADIIDISATVTLTQTFWQCSPQPTPRARYVFPIPAHAAVCAFEMRAEDGRIINAVAKEREVARREHKQAIEQGQMTGLVEHVTDDVFMISLGSLPQLQTITTRLTYVMDLTDDDFTDQIRLQLPVSVGTRFGAVPLDMVDAEHIPFERVSINVDVYMKGKILSITSPSHPTVTSQDGVAVYHVPGAHGQSVWYRSPLFLAEDFVLSVKAADLDKPHCFAERGLTGSTALQFSFVPKFKLPTIASQEYIFLVDRSGSMGGVRIQMAKRALVMLLRALPKDGTIFNIFSFGNMCTSLWGESMTYDAQTLQEATEHIDNMNADYGGTQIRSALCHMFQMRCSQLPTVCFLLTDGESWDTDHTIAEVTKARSAATPEAPLRMFTLGIGETTSTEMCQGIARAGGGICLMATTNEAIVAKTSKLVKAGRAEILQDVTIDWGVPLQLVEQQADLQSVALLQGPRVLPPLYDNIRFIVFALIGKAEISIPQQVVLRARRRGTEEPFEVPVLVEVLEGSTDLPQRPMIHTLAARRIIMDLEDKACGNVSPTSKQSIIHLGEQYQLASRFTSFIAVDSDSQERLDTIEPIKVKRSVFVKQRLSKVAIRPRPLVFPSRLGSSGPAPPPPPPPPPLAPSASSSHSTRPPPSPRLAAAPPAPPPTFCPALPPTSPHSHAVSARSAASRRVATPAAYSLSPSTSFAVMPDASKPIYPEEDRVVQLVRLQSFDGSFSDSPTLNLILGENIVAEGVKKGIDSTVWATVLAVAYLRKHLANQPDLLEGLVEKATEFLGQCPEVDVQMLLELANNLVA